MLRSRALVALTIGVATAGLMSAARADQTVTSSASGASEITVFLKAPDPAALAALAAGSTGLSRAQRLAALTQLVPSSATREGVADSLRRSGFRVVSQTTWSITASGAPATSKALFGSRPAARTGRAATAALPRVPAALNDSVAAVFPTTGGPPAFKHHATSTLKGLDFRNAAAPAGGTPSTGKKDANLTIATLQLANFYGKHPGFANSQTATDLTTYASQEGIPLASGQYTAVKVDTGPSATDDSERFGNDVEVALDQESILSTAPTAKQRAYFAPNTSAGYNDVFAQVYDDVTGHSTDPDPSIAAMSVSWGGCESETDPKDIATLEPILQSLTAAGVTVFASSGDDGIYDCSDGTDTADVDYPGSSPSVVSVGGTYLQAPTSAPNTGKNWTETAWKCTDAFYCQPANGGDGGSGGGASGSAYAPDAGFESFAGFPIPAYQQAGIDNSRYARSAKRLVPDIAADASPSSGFSIYSGDEEQVGPSHRALVGGTSLSSPVSAAQLINTLGDAGLTSGVGDIHAALYTAYRDTHTKAATDPARVFRDITIGRNGAAGDKSSDPSVYAMTGYDTVTGLGAPLWPALLPYLTDTNHPTATASLTHPQLNAAAGWRSLLAKWTVSHSVHGNLAGATQAAIYRFGSSAAVWRGRYLPASNQHVQALALPGTSYALHVIGHDLSGRTSPLTVAIASVPLDDTWISHSATGWRRVGGGGLDVGGSHIYSTRTGATATFSRTGRSYALRTRVGPTDGRVAVYSGGKLITTINTYRSTYGLATKPIFASSARALRTFTFKTLSTRPVSIDAVYVTW